MHRICWAMLSMVILLVNLFSILLDNSFVMAAGLRPSYVYDYANIIDSNYESVIEGYLRAVDKATSAEIIIYTIPSFIGHGIKKDGHEINERDLLVCPSRLLIAVASLIQCICIIHTHGINKV